MTLQERIIAFEKWGNALFSLLDELESDGDHDGNALINVIRKASHQNGWFTPEQVKRALKGICFMLEKNSLETWLAPYKTSIDSLKDPKKVAVIMAGNIPAVGFHDALCVLASGHTLLARCSSDDKLLIPFLTEVLISLEPRFNGQIKFVEKVENQDAVIATGSNNSSRYFEYYFGKYPHIIRKNRNSIAILSGRETDEELQHLGEDIFAYFGLGCRNVSKLYVPEGYDFGRFFPSLTKYDSVMQHNKYINNHDYQNAVYLLNSESFLTNNYLIVKENQYLSTPVSVLHFEYYSDLQQLEKQLSGLQDQIQCRVGVGGIPFGTTQLPGPSDYADGIDTMKFLIELK
jgi:hypothetical protein